jgi:hypothetical protein
MVPHEASLELYQVHAVTEGTDAQAEVSVRLSHNGRSVTGAAPIPIRWLPRQGLSRRAQQAAAESRGRRADRDGGEEARIERLKRQNVVCKCRLDVVCSPFCGGGEQVVSV